MESLGLRLRNAIESKRISERIWFYSNYHCNLACTYCLTESSPQTPKRSLSRADLLSFAQQAKKLGFLSLGITGGEPFLLPWLIDALPEISDILPVTILSNGTLFNERTISKMRALGDKPIRIQISLDYATAQKNDLLRGTENFNRVVEAVPKLLACGIHIRIASTIENQTPAEREALKNLVSSWGIPPKDHIIRPIVLRGRAVTNGMGERATVRELSPELTITKEGAFWSPFGPTYKEKKLQTDLLLCRKIVPLQNPTRVILDYIESRPDTGDTSSGFV